MLGSRNYLKPFSVQWTSITRSTAWHGWVALLWLGPAARCRYHPVCSLALCLWLQLNCTMGWRNAPLPLIAISEWQFKLVWNPFIVYFVFHYGHAVHLRTAPKKHTRKIIFKYLTSSWTHNYHGKQTKQGHNSIINLSTRLVINHYCQTLLLKCPQQLVNLPPFFLSWSERQTIIPHLQPHHSTSSTNPSPEPLTFSRFLKDFYPPSIGLGSPLNLLQPNSRSC